MVKLGGEPSPSTLLTMRASERPALATNSDLILRSRAQRGVSKDGHKLIPGKSDEPASH
jgi:hypothetical protein